MRLGQTGERRSNLTEQAWAFIHDVLLDHADIDMTKRAVRTTELHKPGRYLVIVIEPSPENRGPDLAERIRGVAE